MAHNGDVYGHPQADRLRASVDEALSVAITWTPRDALAAKEPLDDTDPEEHLARLRVAVMMRSFVLLAEFLTAGVTQADELEVRSLIVLRAVAPRLLWERYQIEPEAARKREAALRKRSRKAKRLRHHGPGVSLAALLRGGLEDEEIELAQMQDCTAVQLRRETLERLCAMIAKEARRIADFPKIAAAFLRRAKPDFLAGLGDSGAAIARKYGEQRATVSVREIRVVEKPMLAAGVKGVHLLGGTKSDAHRAACAEAQKGNTNRADGEARKRGEHPVSEDFETPTEIDADRVRVAAARRAYEQRRLVALFGEGVAGCDPERTVPARLVG